MNLDVVAVIGGAGFIGSHFVDALLATEATKRVVIYDNFSSGREWHFEQHKQDSRLEIVRGEIADRDRLAKTLKGVSTVIHLASNPDIAAAMNRILSNKNTAACIKIAESRPWSRICDAMLESVVGSTSM